MKGHVFDFRWGLHYLVLINQAVLASKLVEVGKQLSMSTE